MSDAQKSPAIIMIDAFGIADVKGTVFPTLSKDKLLKDIRKGMQDLSSKEASDFGTNFVRFLALQADERGLPRPGSVKGRPNRPLEKEVKLSPRADMIMAGIEAVARQTHKQNTAWEIFEDQATSAYHQGLADKSTLAKPASSQPPILFMGIR